ncbi:MAG: hypothetical protein P4L53_15830 [Candidatus Obscuribacterales bacterium]|nr:hypothetical protein [Candidatus Obscuribacterales bacterium]
MLKIHHSRKIFMTAWTLAISFSNLLLLEVRGAAREDAVRAIHDGSMDEKSDLKVRKKSHRKPHKSSSEDKEMPNELTNVSGNYYTEAALEKIPDFGALSLSESQVQKLAQLKSDFVARTAPIEAQLRITQTRFQQQLNTPELNINEVSSLGSAITMQQHILNGLIIEHRVDMAKILTGPQRLAVESNLQTVAAH